MTNYQTISTDSDYEDNYNYSASTVNLQNYSVKDRTPRSVKIISNDSYLSSFSDLSSFSVTPDINYDYLDNSSYYDSDSSSYNYNYSYSSYYNSNPVNSIPRLMLSSPLISNKITNSYDSDNEMHPARSLKLNKKRITVKKSIKKVNLVPNRSYLTTLIKFHINFRYNLTFRIENLINFFKNFKFRHNYKHNYIYNSKSKYKNKYRNKNKSKNKNTDNNKNLAFQLIIYDDT